MPSSFFVNNGGSTAARTTITDDLTASAAAKSDAQKLALNAEDAQFTLSDGVTTGNSALHYNAKANASATAAAGSATTATQQAVLANDAKLAAQTAKAEAVALHTDAVQLTGDQTIAGAKSFTSNVDVTGSVTASDGIYLGGTGAANKLDDYEEGTWMPVVAGSTSSGTGTYQSRLGKYTKIGNRVMIEAQIFTTAHTGTGNFLITGLPFASKNESPSGYNFGRPLATSNSYLNGAVDIVVNNNTTSLTLVLNPQNGATVSNYAIDGLSRIRLSGHYDVA